MDLINIANHPRNNREGYESENISNFVEPERVKNLYEDKRGEQDDCKTYEGETEEKVHVELPRVQKQHLQSRQRIETSREEANLKEMYPLQVGRTVKENKTGEHNDKIEEMIYKKDIKIGIERLIGEWEQ